VRRLALRPAELIGHRVLSEGRIPLPSKPKKTRTAKLTGVLKNRREIKYVVGCSPAKTPVENGNLQSTLPALKKTDKIT
jgi:hypothetical protein